MNWLIAEDEADIRNLVAMMCQVWGHNPMTYESGHKVWELLDQLDAGTYSGEMPEFALMDIRMPGRRGDELSKRMRTVEQLKNIPIVLMTAFVLSDEEMAHMKEEFGIDHVINKPLPDFDRLKVIIDKVIADKS